MPPRVPPPRDRAVLSFAERRDPEIRHVRGDVHDVRANDADHARTGHLPLVPDRTLQCGSRRTRQYFRRSAAVAAVEDVATPAAPRNARDLQPAQILPDLLVLQGNR